MATPVTTPPVTITVRAIIPGYLGCYRAEGATFSVPYNVTSSWFQPADEAQAKKKADAEKAASKATKADATTAEG